jgi:hypothetical protein
VFDARRWLAGQIACDRDDLQLSDGRVRFDYRGAQDGSYTRGTTFAGRVIVTGPKTMIETEEPHRTVMAVWPGGSALRKIGADEQVVW